MKTWFQIFFAFIFFGLVLSVHAQTSSVEKIIQTEGLFAFSDGSSTYQFYKDGKFVLEPVGVSGRTIQGVWKSTESSFFQINGKWQWVNGVSPDNDFRRMTLHINVMSDQPVGKESFGASKSYKTYPVYFTVEELAKISRAEYNKGTQSKPTVTEKSGKTAR